MTLVARKAGSKLWKAKRNLAYFWKSRLQICWSISGPRITPFCSMSFCYNIDDTPQELNSCLYRLAYGKLISLLFCLKSNLIDIKWGLLKNKNCLVCVSRSWDWEQSKSINAGYWSQPSPLGKQHVWNWPAQCLAHDSQNGFHIFCQSLSLTISLMHLNLKEIQRDLLWKKTRLCKSPNFPCA